MSWLDYYELLKKYDGNLRRATKAEMAFAAKCNPNDPPTARLIAQNVWESERNLQKDKS
jgi:hypothetical protein